ncbi:MULTISPECIES: TetR-like C-terminal domain-containing protein [unclassified Streptomyces]|uniref:TetR-like C-terminal domain-containing protein n=1 Tax=unclassified Streptomyces TaxID=2593676 RepID=UPI0036E369F6
MSIQKSAATRHERLTPGREREIPDTAPGLVAEVGHEQATVNEAARRTEAGTADLRQRESSPGPATTAVSAHTYEPLTVIDTGELRGDLVAVARQLPSAYLPSSGFAPGIRQMVRPATPAQDVYDALLTPYLRALRTVLDRHVEQGTIRPDNPALEFAETLMSASILMERLLTGEEVTTEHLITVTDALLLPALTGRSWLPHHPSQLRR